MASVPDRFIREKNIDYIEEIASIMNVETETGGIKLPPFTLGQLSLLEILDNKVLKGEKDATIFDYVVIFYVLKKGRKAKEKVIEYSRGYKKPLERSVNFFNFFNNVKLFSIKKIIENLNTAFTGFDMLPKSGGSGKYLFGAETISNICYVACQKLNKTYEEIMWDTPLTLIGHISATNAHYNGLKGIGRRKDEAHLKYIFKKCKEWDKEKKLYPWQWLEPQFYPLEPYQDSKEIKRDYKERLNEVTNAKVKRKN